MVSALTDDRLLTVTEGSVEVCHESLFREWPRYRAWLEEDREGRRLHAHLMAGAREWESGGRDSSDLYRGARLTGALEWAAAHAEEMTSGERRFLDAGRRHAGRQARRLRTLLVAMALLAVASLVAGLVALSQKRHASTAARIALARQLGVEAVNEPRIDRAMLLAREAVNLDPSAQTESSLLSTILRSPAVTGTLSVPGDAAFDPVVSPDGRVLAVSTVNGLRLYHVRTHAPLGTLLRDLVVSSGEAAAYSPDGSQIVYPAADANGEYLAVRDAHTLALTARLNYPPSFEEQQTANVVGGGIQIAPDRKTVYYPYWRLDSAGEPGAAYIDRWSLPGGSTLAPVKAGSGPLLAVRLVDAGTQLVTVSANEINRFNARSMRLLRAVSIDPAPASPSAAALSPDGRTAIIGSAIGTVSFVDASTGKLRRATVEHSGSVDGTAYAAEGGRPVTFGDDGNVIVWDPGAAAPVSVLAGPAGGTDAGALSPNGERLYTTSRASGEILTWDLTSKQSFARRVMLGRPFHCCGQVPSSAPPLATSPDGSRFAARIAPARVALFSATSLHRLASFTVSPGTDVTTLAWSPSGTQLAVGGPSGLLQLWSVAGSPRLQRTLSGLGPLVGLPDVVEAAAFSPDGKLVAATDYNKTQSAPGIPAVPLGRLGVWRVHNGTPTAAPRDLGLGAPGVVDQLAFAQRGHLLAVSRPDGSVWLLDPWTGRLRHSLVPARSRARLRSRPTERWRSGLAPATSSCGTLQPASRSVPPCSSLRPLSPRWHLMAPVGASPLPAITTASSRSGSRRPSRKRGRHSPPGAAPRQIWLSRPVPETCWRLTRVVTASLGRCPWRHGCGTPAPWRAATSLARSGQGSTPAARMPRVVAELSSAVAVAVHRPPHPLGRHRELPEPGPTGRGGDRVRNRAGHADHRSLPTPLAP